jgi:nitrogen regulatory protein P-II 1
VGSTLESTVWKLTAASRYSAPAELVNIRNEQMKLVIAYIQPHKLKDVKQALYKAEVFKVSVTNALGCGEQLGYQESYRGIKFEVNLLKKVRLEIGVNEDFVEKTINAIIEGAKTGQIGDGKIFVVDLPECIRIRTGESGSKAIG